MNYRYKMTAAVWLFFFTLQLNAVELYAQAVRTSGTLNFKCNGQLFTADSTHARAYALKQNGTAFLKAANAENIVLSAEWIGLKGTGTYLLTVKNSKADFSINHKTYSLKQDGDYIKIIVSSAKQSGPFLLLNGSFEGQLQDKAGAKIKITEGRFETASL